MLVVLAAEDFCRGLEDPSGMARCRAHPFLMKWSNPHSCPTSESCIIFSTDLLFYSLLKVVFQSVHVLVDANLC